ncbi:MAG: hypothetical protein ACRDWY_06775 [Actinomycetes bacterium]
MFVRRAATAAASLIVGVVVCVVVLAGVLVPAGTGAVATKPLANLDHLDWLTVTVQPPAQARHTTYRLAEEPGVGVLWTYAEPGSDGTFRHVGGGTYDPATDTWGQGAFNADDISRAAVVYLRHWQATGKASSRDQAYEMLRGLTYLQTASGPDAGNVVLWMQPDGTLNPSAEPVEQPDPSDSDASYWLARTVWALGEGYAAFRDRDPAFAGFLRDRLDLAIDALDRQVLDRYGEWLDIDGERAPAWLVVDGADATAEAVLGLSAYVDAGGPASARTALARFAAGIEELSAGDARTWMFGAIRPWVLSRSVWHGWGSQMPAALARASQALGDDGLVNAASTDSNVFDPWLLTSGGPDNGRLPTRLDTSQIAYGVDSRVQSLLATAEATGQSGARRLAGMFAAWYFGANAAGAPAYDPATGRTVDGIAGDGTVNRNSGAESTIHGLLSMLALDANPDVAELARTAAVEQRVGTTTVQAEAARLSGDATAVAPDALWTGESLYGGTGYAALGDGGRASFSVPKGPRCLVLPVVDLRPGSSAVTTFRSGGRTLGSVESGAVGRQGDSPAPGALLPTTLQSELGAGPGALEATTRADGDDRALLDSVMLEPLVSRYVLGGDGHGTALLRSAAGTAQRTTVQVPGAGPATVEVYDGAGRLRSRTVVTASVVPVSVLAGGYTIARR